MPSPALSPSSGHASLSSARSRPTARPAGSIEPESGEWTRVKSSTDEAAAGPPDGDPATIVIAEQAGFAQWLHARDGASTTGDMAASRLGQVSWAMFEWARDPFVLLITIYLFAPYFSNHVVGDGVRGQGLAGEIQAYSGIVIAILAPFLGA